MPNITTNHAVTYTNNNNNKIKLSVFKVTTAHKWTDYPREAEPVRTK